MAPRKGFYRVGTSVTFSAAHQLVGHERQCGDLHGHNWMVEAVFGSNRLDKLGMVRDFYHLKAAMETIAASMDHKVLNELPAFATANPTAEKVAEHFFSELRKALGVKPVEVKVFETEHTWSSFSG